MILAPPPNPDQSDSLELTTAVTSCNLDIHNCTDDSRLFSPSFMMYDAVMRGPSSRQEEEMGGFGNLWLGFRVVRWDIYTRVWVWLWYGSGEALWGGLCLWSTDLGACLLVGYV
jgi:hypothetical protein